MWTLDKQLDAELTVGTLGGGGGAVRFAAHPGDAPHLGHRMARDDDEEEDFDEDDDEDEFDDFDDDDDLDEDDDFDDDDDEEEFGDEEE